MPPSHTCPHCDRTSYHPIDVAEHYCAACHHFCDDPQLTDQPLWDDRKDDVNASRNP